MVQHSNFIVRGGMDYSNITKGIKTVQTQLTGFQNKISKSTKLIGAALGGITIGTFVKDSTKAAMTVESSIGQIGRTLGNNSLAFNKWVQNQSKSFGMAKEDAYKYGATYSNLLSGFLSGTDETQAKTEQLLKASAVTASATGRTMEDTMERIRSGLLGNTESIEDLGINVNVAMLQSSKAFQQFANGRTWNQLSFQEQQQIRLMAILEQVNKKYGNSLAGTTATRQMQFIATLKNIRLNLGQAFLPIYNVVLPAFNALASKIETITANLSAMSQAFFGKAIEATVSNTNNQADAVANIGDAAEKTGDKIAKAGKQASKSVASFDEITMLNKNSSSDSDTGSAGTTGAASKQEASVKETNTNSGFTNWLSKVKDAAQPTIDALKRLGEALMPIGKFSFEVLKSFYEDVLVPIGKWVLGEGLPGLLNAVSNLLEGINWDKLSGAIKNFNEAIAPLAIAIGQGLINFVTDLSNILKPVVAKTIDLLADAIDSLANSLGKIDPKQMEDLGYGIGVLTTSLGTFKALSKLPALLLSIETGLGGLAIGLSNLAYMNPIALPALFDMLGLDEWADELYQKLPAWVRNLWEGVWYSFASILQDVFNFQITSDLVNDIAARFKDVFDGNSTWYEIGGNIVLGILEGIAVPFSIILQPINGLLAAFAKAICDVFGIHSPAKEMKPYGEYITLGLLKGITDGWENAWKDFSSWLGSLPGKIATGFGSLKEWFATKGGQIISGIEKGWSDGWKGFKDWLGNIPSQIASGIGSLYNVGRGIIQDLIKGFQSMRLPKIKIDVSYVTEGIPGKIGKAFGLEGFPKLDLNFYKNGGLPDVGELFVANEAGPEMIGRMGSKSAVANTGQIVDGITQGVSNANSEQNALLRQQNALLQAILNKTGITTKGIFDAVRKENNDFITANGYSALGY